MTETRKETGEKIASMLEKLSDAEREKIMSVVEIAVVLHDAKEAVEKESA